MSESNVYQIQFYWSLYVYPNQQMKMKLWYGVILELIVKLPSIRLSHPGLILCPSSSETEQDPAVLPLPCTLPAFCLWKNFG